MNLEEYRQMYDLENTHWYFRGKRTLVRKVLLQTLAPHPNRTLLDVGCGTGNILLMLQEFGEAVGVDSSPVALEFCRTRNLSNLHLVSEDNSLPFADESFDAVCALDLLEHIDDPLFLLKEIKRVTQKNGTILIIVPAHPHLWSEHDVALHHKRRYTKKQLRRLIRTADLAVGRLTYFNSLLFPVALLYRTLKKILPKRKSQPARSEFFIELPPVINSTLLKLFEVEGAVLPKHNIPFGLSLLAVCEKGSAARLS